MASVGALLSGLGFHQAGPDFYLPQAHPHIHLRVDNGAAQFPSLQEVLPHIVFISLSWGGAVGEPTVNLYQRGAAYAGGLEQLATGHFSRTKKSNFENALANRRAIESPYDIARALNRLTGIDIDT